jgi:hypothetical protein
MIESLFPSLGEWTAVVSAYTNRVFALVVLGIIVYALWRQYWRNWYPRRIRQTFENLNLFVKPKKDKLFPQLIDLSSREDANFYVFRYRLRPGMQISQFEDKKKMFESAFHRKAEVFGKGAILTIKIKKNEYRWSESGWTSDPKE